MTQVFTKGFFFILFYFTCFNCFSQDIVLKMDGDEVKAKIIEVGNSDVKYKRFDYQTGPTISLSKSEIFYIKYENGEKVVFEKKKSNPEFSVPQSSMISYEKMFSPKDYGEFKRIKWTVFNQTDLEYKSKKIEAFDLSGTLTEKDLKSGLDTLFKYQSEIVAINISNCNLTSFPKKLVAFKKLKYIIAQSNNILILNSEYANCSAVKFIDVSYNKIQSVDLPNPKNQLDTNLIYLNLAFNQITYYPAGLNKIKSIKALDLSNNRFGYMSPMLKDLTNLRYLNYSNNRIAKIPVELFSLKLISTLNLSSCNISVFPKEIVNFVNLTNLNLSNNNFILNDSIIHCFKKIKTLEICNLGLKSFPKEILNLTLLQKLNISNDDSNKNNNSISEIPDSVGNLKNLEEFYCNNTGLSKIPEQLFSIASLKELQLNSNEITRLPSNSKELLYLKDLELNGSPINDADILNLRYAIPYASISYFEPEVNQDFTLPPFSDSVYISTKMLYKSCSEKKTKDCLSLGSYLVQKEDYIPLAIKSFRLVYQNEGCSVNSLLAKLKVADMYDDMKNDRPYFTIKKRRNFKDYEDYINNYENSSLSMNLYQEVCNCGNNENTASYKNKGCKKTYEFYSSLSDNLKDIYETNSTEIRGLITDVATWKKMSAENQALMASQTTVAGSLIYGTGSMAGLAAASAKESRLNKLQSQNAYLETKIKSYSDKAKEISELIVDETVKTKQISSTTSLKKGNSNVGGTKIVTIKPFSGDITGTEYQGVYQKMVYQLLDQVYHGVYNVSAIVQINKCNATDAYNYRIMDISWAIVESSITKDDGQIQNLEETLKQTMKMAKDSKAQTNDNNCQCLTCPIIPVY